MADSLCRVIKNSLTEVFYFVLPQIHAASNKACKGHRQNVFLCLQNFLLWALNKKNKRQKVLMWRLREHKYLQACKKITIHDLLGSHPLLGQITYHTHAWENTARRSVSKSNAYQTVCNDWVQVSPFLPLYARHSMYCSQLLSLCRIKMLIFLYFPHMFFDKSKDQTDIVHYGEEKDACRLFRSHSWKHISVWYIWAQPLKS